MTSSDLIVLLPWLAFGAALAIVFLLLLRNSGGPPSPPGPRQAGPDETVRAAADAAGQPAGSDHPGAQP
ncbi:MAG TPA: hypothetical protein VFV73_25920 [Streptosporangiaceae bacterium]|nr:hypothetical protein [Streptosporangiaceae bacterium]